MYDNITIFYKDAEILITPFSAGRVIKLLEKRIANGEETAQNYTFFTTNQRFLSYFLYKINRNTVLSRKYIQMYFILYKWDKE